MASLHSRCTELTLDEERLQRDVSASKTYYEQLAKQREDMMALEASLKLEQGSCIIVANAPVAPSKPSNAPMVWMGLPLGFVLALLATAMLAHVRQEVVRFRGPEERD